MKPNMLNNLSYLVKPHKIMSNMLHSIIVSTMIREAYKTISRKTVHLIIKADLTIVRAFLRADKIIYDERLSIFFMVM